MTLVVAMGNWRHAIQLSDRRLTTIAGVGSSPYTLTDEANKAGFISCKDARLVYGFTGLATDAWPPIGFDARKLLRTSLIAAAAPDYRVDGIIERFSDLMAKEFRTNPAVRAIPEHHRRLTVMFSGFRYSEQGRKNAFWIVSNNKADFADAPESAARDTVSENFGVIFWESPLNAGNKFYVHCVGDHPRVKERDYEHLKKLVSECRPAGALIGAALKLIHNAAGDGSVPDGKIGKQISAIEIPADLRELVTSSFSSNVPSSMFFVPDGLLALGPDQCKWVEMELEAKPNDAGSAKSGIAIVPRVHRNAPCPCGSGLRYRECHRRTRLDIPAAERNAGQLIIDLDTLKLG